MTLFGAVQTKGAGASPCESEASTAPKQLRLKGMQRASEKHREALKLAQWVAELLAGKNGTTCADDVFEIVKPEALGQAAGCIFSGPGWEPVGFRQSTRLSRRAGVQRMWRMRGNRS